MSDRNEFALNDILTRLMPKWEALFTEKNRDYGGTFFFLGVKGQFSDINRKFWKLKAALWDDAELVGEQPDEIIMDMIGHLFLTLHLLDAEVGRTTPTRSMSGNAPRKHCSLKHSHNPHFWSETEDVEGHLIAASYFCETLP